MMAVTVGDEIKGLNARLYFGEEVCRIKKDYFISDAKEDTCISSRDECKLIRTQFSSIELIDTFYKTALIGQ